MASRERGRPQLGWIAGERRRPHAINCPSEVDGRRAGVAQQLAGTFAARSGSPRGPRPSELERDAVCRGDADQRRAANRESADRLSDIGRAVQRQFDLVNGSSVWSSAHSVVAVEAQRDKSPKPRRGSPSSAAGRVRSIRCLASRARRASGSPRPTAGSRSTAAGLRRSSPAPAHRSAASRPSASWSSPDSYISVTMSQPPTSSPLMNSCGIVGQFESDRELLADARIGQHVDGRERLPQRLQDRDGAGREAARRLLRVSLHEQDHGVLADRVLDRLAHRVRALVGHAWSPDWVWIERAWMRSPTSDPNTS